LKKRATIDHLTFGCKESEKRETRITLQITRKMAAINRSIQKNVKSHPAKHDYSVGKLHLENTKEKEGMGK
jgi:hypothetical protein